VVRVYFLLYYRDALLGGPNGTFDEGFEGDEDRVERMGDMLANIIR